MTTLDAMEQLHDIVESACHGWKNSLPPESRDESVLIAQDRLTIRRLLHKADAILRRAKECGYGQ